jgi:hypothetical protein
VSYGGQRRRLDQSPTGQLPPQRQASGTTPAANFLPPSSSSLLMPSSSKPPPPPAAAASSSPSSWATVEEVGETTVGPAGPAARRLPSPKATLPCGPTAGPGRASKHNAAGTCGPGGAVPCSSSGLASPKHHQSSLVRQCLNLILLFRPFVWSPTLWTSLESTLELSCIW